MGTRKGLLSRDREATATGAAPIEESPGQVPCYALQHMVSDQERDSNSIVRKILESVWVLTQGQPTPLLLLCMVQLSPLLPGKVECHVLEGHRHLKAEVRLPGQSVGCTELKEVLEQQQSHHSCSPHIPTCDQAVSSAVAICRSRVLASQESVGTRETAGPERRERGSQGANAA